MEEPVTILDVARRKLEPRTGRIWKQNDGHIKMLIPIGIESFWLCSLCVCSELTMMTAKGSGSWERGRHRVWPVASHQQWQLIRICPFNCSMYFIPEIKLLVKKIKLKLNKGECTAAAALTGTVPSWGSRLVSIRISSCVGSRGGGGQFGRTWTWHGSMYFIPEIKLLIQKRGTKTNKGHQ